MPSPAWDTEMKSFWQTQIFHLRKELFDTFWYFFVYLRVVIFNRSCCSEGAKLIDASGHSIPELLEALLKFFPLDTYVFNPVVLMDLVNSDKKKDMEVSMIFNFF